MPWSMTLSYSATAVPINFYRQQLNVINPAEFKYMGIEERKRLRYQLAKILLELRVDAQAHLDDGRKTQLAQSLDDISKCIKCIRALELIAFGPDLPQQVRSEMNSSSPLKYLALRIYLDLNEDGESQKFSLETLIKESESFIHQIQEIQALIKMQGEKQIDAMRQSLSLANWWRRLWWAFGRNVWLLSLSLASGREVQTATGVYEITTMMGCFNWLLFLLRGTVEFSEALSESMFHDTPIDSRIKLKRISFWSRFSKQISTRKFILINDLLSGVVNTIIFSHFTGSWKTDLGFIGSMLTITVLILDTLLALARFIEASHKHQALLRELDNEKKTLEKLRTENPSSSRYKIQLETVTKAKEDAEMEWRYTQIKLINNVGLTLGLTLGYFMMNTCYLSGLSFMQETVLAISGASLAFLVIILSNIINQSVDYRQYVSVAKTHETEVERLKTMLSAAISENDKRQLFLQIKGYTARGMHQRQLAAYRLKCMPIHTLIDSLTPAAFFLSFHYLLTWQAIAVVAFCFVVILVAKKLMDTWKPVENKHAFFPDFESDPSLEKAFIASCPPTN